jgi:peptide/nickel transport system substrate-binding protein
VKKPKSINSIFEKRWKLPTASKAAEAVSAFSTSERIIFFAVVAVFIVSALSLLWKVNSAFLVTVPKRGGTLQEGVIGSPRFINPLLAISDADEDLTSLVYSGLMKKNADGTFAPDLAESYQVSPDGLTYTFTLKPGLKFQDGTPITADDVAFTVGKAQDATLKSPKLVDWEGVEVSVLSPSQIQFTLQKPYAPFIANTTMGVLPKHIWENISSDEFAFSNYNVEPVGSGPYEVKSVKRDSGGIPVYYRLSPFSGYAGAEPYIGNLVIKFFHDEDSLVKAYKSHSIDSMHGIAPETAASLDDGAKIVAADLSRVFGIFFNQNQQTLFTDAKVRQALDESLDKQEIVDTVLKGYGTPLDGPVPPGLIAGATTSDAVAKSTTTPEERIAAAKSILESDGWKLGEDGVYEKSSSNGGSQRLAFSISTTDAPELKDAANAVADQWKKLGADVTVHIYPLSDLNQNVIRARKYDALLFGQAIGPDLDFYPFWHSSQRNDPGLNVAEYANTETDKLLEDARATTDDAERTQDIEQFDGIIKSETPAVFLYSPSFIYVLPPWLHNEHLGEISEQADRFVTEPSWYIETNRVWQVFAPQVQK